VKRAVLYADGACRGNPGPAGSGAALMTEQGHVVDEAMKYLGPSTNNVAEYMALIIGLEAALKHEVEELEVRMDSKLVVEQMNRKWKVRDAKLLPLAARARELLARIPKVRIRHIPRDENAIADRLANRAIDETA
jgi:ribonuclease HI